MLQYLFMVLNSKKELRVCKVLLNQTISSFENKPIIIKDTYTVSGSDMAQIGWIEITTEDGATGYLWYLKSEPETRLRFDDYLETAMIEAVPAEQNSGAAAILGSSGGAVNPGAGSDGIFYSVQQRGNIWDGGSNCSS